MLNQRIKEILISEGEHPLKKLLEIRDGTLFWKEGTAFANQELNYAHLLSQQSIKNLGASAEAAIALENLSPVRKTFHLETYGHWEEIAAKSMSLATPEAQAATKAVADELKSVRLSRARSGERGFVSIGGMIFTLVVVGTAVYAVSQSRDKIEAIKNLAEGFAIMSVVYKLAGGGVVGVIASSTIGMYSDNAQMNREHEEAEAKTKVAEEFIRKNIPSAYHPGYIWDDYDEDIVNQVKQFLFETKPTVISR